MDERTGNALTAFLPALQVSGVPDDAPMPAALVVVRCGRHLLLVFDRFRQQWELPGGGIDSGETPLQAAVRELQEESGLQLPSLTLAGYARFRLTSPPRDEYAAVYTARVPARHHDFVPNREISAICWWDTTGPPPEKTQIIDATLAQQTRTEQHPVPEVKAPGAQPSTGQTPAPEPTDLDLAACGPAVRSAGLLVGAPPMAYGAPWKRSVPPLIRRWPHRLRTGSDDEAPPGREVRTARA